MLRMREPKLIGQDVLKKLRIHAVSFALEKKSKYLLQLENSADFIKSRCSFNDLLCCFCLRCLLRIRIACRWYSSNSTWLLRCRLLYAVDFRKINLKHTITKLPRHVQRLQITVHIAGFNATSIKDNKSIRYH